MFLADCFCIYTVVLCIRCVPANQIAWQVDRWKFTAESPSQQTSNMHGASEHQVGWTSCLRVIVIPVM